MELQEYLLVRDNNITLTKSYESTSLIEAGKILSKKHPNTSFGVVDKKGVFIWQGEGAQNRTPSSE